MQITCQVCYRLFDVTPRRSTTAKFCSKSCKDSSERIPVVKRCKVCSKEFTLRPSEARKISTCSRRCCCIAKRGPGNSNWHGGRTGQRKLEASRLPYKRWRERVFKKCGRVCSSCGSTTRLEVHHLKPWAWFPALRYDVRNGQVLCRPCHQKHAYSLFDLRPAEYQYTFNFGRYNRTHCPSGHLYDAINTVTGHRMCKECNRLNQQRLRDRRKAQSQN